MDDILSESCVPCSTGTPALTGLDLIDRHARLASGWTIVDEHHLHKEYRFRNFREALAFANRVGEIAETVGHHPDMCVSWGRVRLTLWTHKSQGLTDSDFILAARADAVVSV